MLRFIQTFRERSSEWVLSVILMIWGLLVLLSPNLFFTSPFFFPLLLIMSQFHWGLVSTVIGSIRLVFLAINGGWRPSAHIRALGCILGSIIWANLFIASLSIGWISPASATYAGILCLDLLSLWFAAGDAKVADLSVKKE